MLCWIEPLLSPSPHPDQRTPPPTIASNARLAPRARNGLGLAGWCSVMLRLSISWVRAQDTCAIGAEGIALRG
jgi:hypothetical protein